jgi:hypothetical protein
VIDRCRHYAIYLSKFPIVVTGKFRLKPIMILTKLAAPGQSRSDSARTARVHNGRTDHGQGEKESGQEASEESREEEEAVVDLP